MRYRYAIVLVVLTTPAWAGIVSTRVSVFDAPTSIQHATAMTDQGTNEEVDCFYYPEFMVKQVDAHEKGAAQLSFVPVRSGERTPPCERSQARDEQVIAPSEWSGYFTGVKGGYAFFDADDGVNGAMGFAVFDAKNGKKRFTDALKGNIQTLAVNGSTLTFTYMRAYAAPCSVVSGGETCWDSILDATQLPETTDEPDCEASYDSADTYFAKARCRDEKSGAAPACIKRELTTIRAQQTHLAPSMIGYAVTTTLRDSTSEITPVNDKAFCWPAS